VRLASGGDVTLRDAIFPDSADIQKTEIPELVSAGASGGLRICQSGMIAERKVVTYPP
jgi:hypothetical protein